MRSASGRAWGSPAAEEVQFGRPRAPPAMEHGAARAAVTLYAQQSDYCTVRERSAWEASRGMPVGRANATTYNSHATPGRGRGGSAASPRPPEPEPEPEAEREPPARLPPAEEVWLFAPDFRKFGRTERHLWHLCHQGSRVSDTPVRFPGVRSLKHACLHAALKQNVTVQQLLAAQEKAAPGEERATTSEKLPRWIEGRLEAPSAFC